MPEISRFFGIVIKMFFDDHNPLIQRFRGGHPSPVREEEKWSFSTL